MKKFKLILPLLFLLFIINSCNSDEEFIEEITTTKATDLSKPLTKKEVSHQITEILEKKGSFNWSEVNDHLLWSATVHGNNILTVGYGSKEVSFRTEKSKHLSSIKEIILQTIKTTSKNKNEKDILIYDDDLLNYIDVKVVDFNTIKELRKNEQVRYLEPGGFVYTGFGEQERSSKGCDKSSDYISTANYGTLASGAKIPWNFYDHKINQAWAYSKGEGIGVGVIDTGVSPNQSNLGTNFNAYYSGRYIQKYGTYIDSVWWWSNNLDGPNDKCGHGTSASAAVAAPDNNNSQFVGAAYQCNLISYRGTSDVLLNDYHERKGVADALKALGRRNDVKIISMSVGYPWSIGKIKDAVRYAYAQNKLIFAAGGTSTNFTNWFGVIFPASMNETVAVTGVEEQSTYDECDVCHTGSKIDFTVIMERENNNHQPVLGFYNGDSTYFGGSSVATATTAGIAALVWAKYPWASRSQVLQRLKESAAFYPTKNGDFGYGNIDALRAVRGY
ncbi:MAG: S8/S53 family peptidase [Flavobacteriaceae bacterium]|nr:S8/S53 family peptidase [Flavobacteriaceae bacterium]